MKIALIGYGKMGRMVEQAAADSGLEVACVRDPATGSRGEIADAQVWVDFSEPDAVIENIRAASAARASIVIGTTGWYDRMDEARRIVREAGTGCIYGSNFSIGVNLMFRIVEHAAALFSRFPSYDVFIEESHHKFKKDAPSGTAIFLNRIIEGKYNFEAPTASTRAGYIPGTHRVGFDAEADTVTITHTARNRMGFAQGAIVAARWIAGRSGFYDFSEVIDEQLKKAMNDKG